MKPVTDPSLIAALEKGAGVVDTTPRSRVNAYDPAKDYSAGERFLMGMGKAGNDLGTGLVQRVNQGINAIPIVGKKLVSDADIAGEQANIEALRRMDKPIMDTPAAIAGNITGNVGIALPLMAAPGAQSLAGTVATGGALGAVQPTTADESVLANTALGGAGGAAGYGIGALINKGMQFGRELIRPVTGAGQRQVAGKVFNEVTTDPAAAQMALQNASEIIPGSLPTAAEASKDAGIATLQRAMQGKSPVAAGEFAARELDQNAARVSALRGVSGDEAAVTAAEAARNAATLPLRAKAKEAPFVDTKNTVSAIDKMLETEAGRRPAVRGALTEVRNLMHEPFPIGAKADEAHQALSHLVQAAPRMKAAELDQLKEIRLIASRVRSGRLPMEEAIDSLKSIKTTNSYVEGALKDTIATYNAPNTRQITDAERLVGVRSAISDLMQGKVGGDQTASKYARKELMEIQARLDASLEKSAPEWRQFLTQHADLSKPIDQMKVLQEIQSRATRSQMPNARGDLTLYPDSFGNAVKADSDLVRAATGFQHSKGLADVLSPAQMKTLADLQQDLANRKFAQEGGRAVGSNTFQNFSSANLLSSLTGKPMEGRGALSNALGAIPQKIYNMTGSDKAIEDLIRRGVLDPKLAAQLMSEASASRPTEYIGRKTLSSLGYGGGQALLGLGSAQ